MPLIKGSVTTRDTARGRLYSVVKSNPGRGRRLESVCSINAACLHVADPRQWTDQNVAQWLAWTVNEFSLKSVDFDKFCMNGATLCSMGKERFLDLAPDFVGDILWEHLEMLQKGEALPPPGAV